MTGVPTIGHFTTPRGARNRKEFLPGAAEDDCLAANRINRCLYTSRDHVTSVRLGHGASAVDVQFPPRTADTDALQTVRWLCRIISRRACMLM